MQVNNRTYGHGPAVYQTPQKGQSDPDLLLAKEDSQMSFAASPEVFYKNPVLGHQDRLSEGSTNFESAEKDRVSSEKGHHSLFDSPGNLFGSLNKSQRHERASVAGIPEFQIGFQTCPKKHESLESVEHMDDSDCDLGMLDDIREGEFENDVQSAYSNVRLTHNELQLPYQHPVEQDRFIPHRQQNSNIKFDAKELLFSKTQFNCSHSAQEQCDCGNKIRAATDHTQEQSADNNKRMYDIMLASQLLDAKNPHCLEAGALNDMADEHTGGLVQSDHLARKHNALTYWQVEPQTVQTSQLSWEDTQEHSSMPYRANTSSQGSSSGNSAYSLNVPQTYLQYGEKCGTSSFLGVAGQDENSRVALPVFCGFDEEELLSEQYKKQRVIPKQPFKVLDAPCLQDDFYLNLVDWSAKNVLAVGLGSCIYLWSANNSKVTKLSDIGPNNRVTSVQWSRDGHHFAVGTHTGELQIWDTVKNTIVRTMGGHDGRICTVAWNNTFLSTGSRDKTILHRDLRSNEHFTAKLEGHKQEVCGLKWSFDDQQLASGGNDNKLLLWCARSSSQPLAKFNQHQAAVKAIAWSPHKQGLLATGGGTQDRTIKFWNTIKLKNLKSIETGSQVCNLMFAKNVNELVSTHGYSQNQINVWRYPSMKKIASLTGHSYRVLYLAASPDGQTLVTGAGDETLRFWNVFPPKKQPMTASIVMPNFGDLR